MLTRMKSTWILFLGGLFLLTGCFEIEERVFLRRDGSGTFTLTLDMGQMKEMMKAMGVSPDQLGDEDPFAELQADFDEQAEKLEALQGVSNARLGVNKEAYVISMMFDFKDVAALNRGVNEVFKNEEDPDDTYHEYYRYSSGKFERTDYFRQAADVKAEMEEAQAESGMSVESLFADMQYRTVFEFEQPIKSITNEDATLSADKKTVTFQYLFFDPEHEGRNPKNVIRF